MATESNDGLYQNLRAQLERLLKHTHQGSIRTRHRYAEAANRFCRFAADEYRLQKFANMQEKHLVAYAKCMIDKGLAASTIKTDLSALRFFADQCGAKHVLPDNKALTQRMGQPLPQRSFGDVPRAWTQKEFRLALDIALAEGQTPLAWMMALARTQGLRIHETTRLAHTDLTEALDRDALVVKGKGGLIREIPLTGGGRRTIKAVMRGTHDGGRLFVAPEQKTHQVIRQIENWIYRHRDEFKEADVRLTFHGLRHAFAQERYQLHLERLHDPQQARLAVARELGHGRDDVTRIYLRVRTEETDTV